MKYFKIPVSYEVCGEVEVEANSVEEALEWAIENHSEMELPYRPEYVEDSYTINDDIEFVKFINGIKE